MAGNAPDAKLARVVGRLSEALRDGSFYSALQLCRTLAKRKADAGDVDGAREILLSSAQALLAHGKVNEGLDLGDMLIKTYEAGKVVPTHAAMAAIRAIADAVPAAPSVANTVAAADVATSASAASSVGCSSTSPRGASASAAAGSGASSSGPQRKMTPAVARLDFLRAAVRWAAHAPPAPVENAGTSGDAHSSGALSSGQAAAAAADPDVELVPEVAASHERAAPVEQLHLWTARAAVAAGPAHFGDAQRHFLEANSAHEFGEFVYGWARSGYSVELDLFLARAVLQLLCLGNLRDANAVTDAFLAKAAADGVSDRIDTPLAHFLRFLLLTLEVRDVSTRRRMPSRLSSDTQQHRAGCSFFFSPLWRCVPHHVDVRSTPSCIDCSAMHGRCL